MHPAPLATTLDTDTVRKITVRTIPLLAIGFMVAYLDRANISFAALSMNKDLGFTETTFGLGAGVFFVGYLLCEVPSNMLLNRFGARCWLARIMLSWGIVSALTAAVNTPTSYYILRFLLGAAEAGFLPGVLLYLRIWFPEHQRVRIMSAFLISIPLSSVVSAPISLSLMKMDGVLGLHGWQWLLLIEGVPSVLLGLVIWRMLPDRIEKVGWLTEDQKNALVVTLRNEDGSKDSNKLHDFRGVFFDARVWILGFINLALVICIYALLFWLPQIVNIFGWSRSEIGWSVALANILSVIAMLFWGRLCKQNGESIWNFVAPGLVGAVSLIVGSQSLDSPLTAVVAFSIASAGLYAALPAFWGISASILSGAAAVSGFAFIGSIGSLSGIIGPPVIGYVKDRTHSFSAGIEIMAAVLVSALLMLIAIRRKLWPETDKNDGHAMRGMDETQEPIHDGQARGFGSSNPAAGE